MGVYKKFCNFFTQNPHPQPLAPTMPSIHPVHATSGVACKVDNPTPLVREHESGGAWGAPIRVYFFDLKLIFLDENICII